MSQLKHTLLDAILVGRNFYIFNSIVVLVLQTQAATCSNRALYYNKSPALPSMHLFSRQSLGDPWFHPRTIYNRSLYESQETLLSKTVCVQETRIIMYEVLNRDLV